MYFCSFLCFLLHFLCCVSYCLPDFQWFDFFDEIFVAEFVLVPLSSTALDSDSDSTSSAPTSFRLLLLIPRGVFR
jgi:hypothetical protein